MNDEPGIDALGATPAFFQQGDATFERPLDADPRPLSLGEEIRGAEGFTSTGGGFLAEAQPAFAGTTPGAREQGEVDSGDEQTDEERVVEAITRIVHSGEKAFFRVQVQEERTHSLLSMEPPLTRHFLAVDLPATHGGHHSVQIRGDTVPAALDVLRITLAAADAAVAEVREQANRTIINHNPLRDAIDSPRSVCTDPLEDGGYYVSRTGAAMRIQARGVCFVAVFVPGHNPTGGPSEVALCGNGLVCPDLRMFSEPGEFSMRLLLELYDASPYRLATTAEKLAYDEALAAATTAKDPS